jgi:hypothetical protein
MKFQISNFKFQILTAAVALIFFQAAGNIRAEEILANGDFEKADPANPAKPAGWDRVDGLGVQWTQAPDAAHGRAIRMDTRLNEQTMQAQWIKTSLTNIWNIPKPGKNAIAETYGLSLYSAPMPVKPGQAYRITFDFKGRGGAKVWVRGYGIFAGEKRRRWETFVDCHGKSDEWTTQSQIFHPTKFRKDVTEIKVMLFAYYPAGVYWFDNVHIEPVAEPQVK